MCGSSKRTSSGSTFDVFSGRHKWRISDSLRVAGLKCYKKVVHDAVTTTIVVYERWSSYIPYIPGACTGWWHPIQWKRLIFLEHGTRMNWFWIIRMRVVSTVEISTYYVWNNRGWTIPYYIIGWYVCRKRIAPTTNTSVVITIMMIMIMMVDSSFWIRLWCPIWSINWI